MHAHNPSTEEAKAGGSEFKVIFGCTYLPKQYKGHRNAGPNPGRLHPGVRSDRIWLGRLVCRHLQQKAITGAARDTGPSSNYATISTPARGDKVSPIPPSLMETLEPA